ncbi:MAG: hypothetical protein LBN11_02890 [Tannerella sp.]|jgi:hypothetical protein|nr:hypothetical protein [Tannerella sp.]
MNESLKFWYNMKYFDNMELPAKIRLIVDELSEKMQIHRAIHKNRQSVKLEDVWSILLLVPVSLSVFFFVACNFHVKKEFSATAKESLLPPLDSGVVYCRDKWSQDTLIHLTGEKILDDTLVRNVDYLLLKDSQLILHNSGWDEDHRQPRQKFRHYALPSMQFVKQVESTMSYPEIISSQDTDIVCYLWPRPYQQLYKYYNFGKMEIDLALPYQRNDRISSINHIGNDTFLYRKDDSITRTINRVDAIPKKIYDLPMRPSRGKLIVNVAKNRMVFAYEYYHLFLMMDLEAKTVKTIDFNNGNHHYNHKHEFVIDGLNPNKMFYRDAYAGEDYFYLLYLGYSNEEFMTNLCQVPIVMIF